MMSFFALIIVYCQKYQPKAGLGTLIATMLQYSVTFFIAWTALLVVWIIFGIPLGPEAGLYYQKKGWRPGGRHPFFGFFFISLHPA